MVKSKSICWVGITNAKTMLLISQVKPLRIFGEYSGFKLPRPCQSTRHQTLFTCLALLGCLRELSAHGPDFIGCWSGWWYICDPLILCPLVTCWLLSSSICSKHLNCISTPADNGLRLVSTPAADMALCLILKLLSLLFGCDCCAETGRQGCKLMWWHLVTAEVLTLVVWWCLVYIQFVLSLVAIFSLLPVSVTFWWLEILLWSDGNSSGSGLDPVDAKCMVRLGLPRWGIGLMASWIYELVIFL